MVLTTKCLTNYLLVDRSSRRQSQVKRGLTYKEAVEPRLTRRGSTLKKRYAPRVDPVDLQKVIAQKRLISGESPKRIGWDVYMMVLILYYSMAVPYRVSWDLDPDYEALEHFFTSCFILDIVFNWISNG